MNTLLILAAALAFLSSVSSTETNKVSIHVFNHCSTPLYSKIHQFSSNLELPNKALLVGDSNYVEYNFQPEWDGTLYVDTRNGKGLPEANTQVHFHFGRFNYHYISVAKGFNYGVLVEPYSQDDSTEYCVASQFVIPEECNVVDKPLNCTNYVKAGQDYVNQIVGTNSYVFAGDEGGPALFACKAEASYSVTFCPN